VFIQSSNNESPGKVGRGWEGARAIMHSPLPVHRRLSTIRFQQHDFLWLEGVGSLRNSIAPAISTTFFADTSNPQCSTSFCYRCPSNDAIRALVTIVLLLVAFPTISRAQQPSGAVAVINVQRAIFASDEGQREFRALSKKLGLQQEEMRTQQNQIAQRILQKMGPMIIKSAADNGVGVILDTSNPLPAMPIVWVDPQLDITQAVVSAYNGGSSHWVATATATATKIGTINVQQAIFASDEGQREFTALGENGTKEQRQEIAQRILQEMRPSVVQYAKDNGFSILILIDTSNPWPQGPVLWSAPEVNISKRILPQNPNQQSDSGLAVNPEPNPTKPQGHSTPPGSPGFVDQASSPIELKEGQTPAEVEKVLGKPSDTITLKGSLVYVYPTVKVVFEDGKLVDVQYKK